MMTDSINEMSEIRHILNSIPPLNRPRIMIQIGASEGCLAERFATIGWEVFAFEANPAHRAELEGRQEFPRLHLYNQAIVTEERDHVTFYTSQELAGIGSLRSFHPTHQPVQVPAITLTDFYSKNGIKAIDYFMIDAETMDLEIMKTHDWSIPISALLMECGVHNIGEITDFVLSQVPSYQHVVFCWQKPTGALGEQGVCISKLHAKAFMNMPSNCFGNVLFYQFPFQARLMHFAIMVKRRIPLLRRVSLHRRP